MQVSERDKRGWSELRALRDDDRLGAHVRRLVSAHERGDRSTIREIAVRLLMDLPADLAEARALLRILRDLAR